MMTQHEAEYDPGRFTDVESIWGARLWSFLNERESVAEMTNASDANRPAAEAIALRLFQQFGEVIRENRIKQFTGFLIKQVMERHGYQHVAYGRQTRDNPVFSKASQYSRRSS